MCRFEGKDFASGAGPRKLKGHRSEIGIDVENDRIGPELSEFVPQDVLLVAAKKEEREVNAL